MSSWLIWVQLIFYLILIIALVKIIVNLSLMIFKFHHVLPYVPISRAALRAIIKSGVLTNKKTIIDLGCGTGTFLAALKRHYPQTQLVGVEKDFILTALARLRFMGRHNKPAIVRGDMFGYDVSRADAIVGFWISDLTPRLLAKFIKECKPNGVIVSNMFSLPANTHFRQTIIYYGKNDKRKIFVYTPNMVSL